MGGHPKTRVLGVKMTLLGVKMTLLGSLFDPFWHYWHYGVAQGVIGLYPRGYLALLWGCAGGPKGVFWGSQMTLFGGPK